MHHLPPPPLRLSQDYVMVKGSKGLKMACMVQEREDGMEAGYVGLNGTARKNLKVGGDDMITVTACDAMANATSVVFAAIDETVEGINGDLKSVFIEPYFQSEFFGTSGRPVTQGSLICCQGAATEAWFKVISVTSKNGQDYGKVVCSGPRESWTSLEVAPDTISLEEGESALNEVGYSDIGGLSDQLQTIREMVELPIRHPKLFSTIGVKPPKGVLMHGPPGTGKVRRTPLWDGKNERCHMRYLRTVPSHFRHTMYGHSVNSMGCPNGKISFTGIQHAPLPPS